MRLLSLRVALAAALVVGCAGPIDPVDPGSSAGEGGGSASVGVSSGRGDASRDGAHDVGRHRIVGCAEHLVELRGPRGRWMQIPGMSPSCNACFGASCCAQGDACDSDPECSALESCWYACSPFDQNCRYGCMQAHPSGVDGFEKVAVCMAESCSTTCTNPNACGGLTPSAASCTQCVEASCCDAGAWCGNDSACVQLITCLVACAGDPSCAAGCDAQYPVGVMEYQAFLDCMDGACTSACDIVWPRP